MRKKKKRGGKNKFKKEYFSLSFALYLQSCDKTLLILLVENKRESAGVVIVVVVERRSGRMKFLLLLQLFERTPPRY